MEFLFLYLTDSVIQVIYFFDIFFKNVTLKFFLQPECSYSSLLDRMLVHWRLPPFSQHYDYPLIHLGEERQCGVMFHYDGRGQVQTSNLHS